MLPLQASQVMVLLPQDSQGMEEVIHNQEDIQLEVS